MKKKKEEQRLFNKIKPADKSTEEKIIQHYIKNQPDVIILSESEQFVDERAKEIFGLMVNGKPKNWIKNWLLSKHKDISVSYAYKLIEMTEKIYGNSYKVTQEMSKAMFIHREQSIYTLALKEGNLELAEKCNKEIALMQGAKDEVKDQVPEIPAVIFSTNPAFLKPKEIDIEHEEIDDNQQ